jgi:EAL domain-containing protein (putative c-di-GMP-specific phosphodiesterase class I)
LRDGISSRDLIQLRPVIQIQVADADRNLDLAVERGGHLERLGIRLCLNGLGQGGRAARVVGSVPAAFVRLAGEVVRGLAPDRLKALVAWIHERGVRVIVTGADGPEAIARLCAARVDLAQGPYVQSPAESMGFDFAGAESGG